MSNIETSNWKLAIGDQQSTARSRFPAPNSQSGMVSIMVTMIMMIVITLIILGFATVVRRNSREALDRQLSTQAFYAAETGVDDALNAIKTSSVPGLYTNPAFQQQCTALITAMGPGSNIVGTAANGVLYTCLLIDPNPPTVQTKVVLGSSKVLPMTIANSPSSQLTFSWQPTTSNPVNCSGTLTPSPTWTANCPYGVLRVELYRVSPGFDPATMANNTVNSFLVPNTAGGPDPSLVFGNGARSTYVAQASCSLTDCHTALDNVPNGSYYVRLSSVYADAGTVTIGCGSGCTITGAQIMVDATGKAQDVLRRIQVRVPVAAPSIPLPINALQSQDGICKRFGITGSGSTASPDWTATPPLCGP